MTNDRGPFLTNPFVARAARWGLLAWSVIGLLILVYLVYRYVLFPFKVIFPPLVVALIVIYLLNPVVTRLQDRGIKRVWGTLLVYILFLSAVAVGLAYLVAAIANQVSAFVQSVPALLGRAQVGLDEFFTRLGLHFNARDLVNAFQPKGGSAFSFLGRITSFTSGVVHVAFALVLGPLLAFYLLVDLPKIERSTMALVPASRREEAVALGREVGRTLGEFFRGQLIVALLVGLTSMLGFYLIGLPYFALIGALTGLFALVPLIGTPIAAVPALFVALTTEHSNAAGLLGLPGGWVLGLSAVAVLILVHQLDVRVLSPRLFSPTVRMHPVTVLLSLLVGGTLLGLWGMVLAVPTLAALKVVVLHVWDTRSHWPPVPETVVGTEAASPPVARGRRLLGRRRPAPDADGDGAADGPGEGTVPPAEEASSERELDAGRRDRRPLQTG
jgi:predicted PurR-regulated permease PerM